MENRKYITIIKKGEYEFSELDFTLYDEIHPNWNDNDEDSPHELVPPYRTVDGHPILIDTLIQKLKDYKNKGANYVGIDYHVDHIGYNIEFYDIHASREEEIDSHKQSIEASKKRALQKEYDILSKKLDELKKCL